MELVVKSKTHEGTIDGTNIKVIENEKGCMVLAVASGKSFGTIPWVRVVGTRTKIPTWVSLLGTHHNDIHYFKTLDDAIAFITSTPSGAVK